MCKLKKEGLITSTLKSEISSAECSYMKHFNTNVDNNTTNVNTNDDTYDGKIREKISNIRMILSIFNDRMKIKKELYEIRKTFQIRKKKRIMIILLN